LDSPVASSFPSGLTSMEMMASLCLRVNLTPLILFRFSRSQTLAVWSHEAVIACRPSGVRAASRTAPRWPV